MSKFKISLGNTKQLLEKEIIERMNKVNEFMLEEVKKRTPEDKFKLQKNNKIEGVKKEGNKIIGTVSNDTEYAVYVEYGLGKNYNYYKNGGRRKGGNPFRTGNGARMFSFSYDNQENINKIQDIFNK